VITNNSILPFTIQSGELKAFSGETEIGTANLVEKLYIKSKKSKTYPFSIILTLTNHEESMNLLLNSLLGKKSTYLIKGTVNASSFYFFKKKIIINQTFLK